MSNELKELQQGIEAALLAHLPQCRHPGAKILDDALRYAVFPGGKRLRPVLAIMGARIFCGADPVDLRPAMAAACAVEYIHTSSLIFDDLPSMDDAELRRGMPVLHKVYGEDVAMLTAIALLNQSYAIFGRVPALIAEATACIGTEGMIGGQALDLKGLGTDGLETRQSHEYLCERNRKTSAMMRLALTAGALAIGTPAEEVNALGEAGQLLGEAYQIGDDLLDQRRGSEATGKTAGQDQRHNRPSHGRHGEEASFEQLASLVTNARTMLDKAYGRRAAHLLQAVDAIFNAQMAEAGRSS